MKPLARVVFLAIWAAILVIPAVAADEVLFSNPPVQAGIPGADSSWARIGGHAGASLESSEGELFWKTGTHSTILNHFAAAKPVTLNPGEVLVFTFKFKAAGLNPAQNGFQVGLFNSTNQFIEGDRPASPVHEKFKSYAGYIASMNLTGSATFIYRRNPDTEAVDGNALFGLSTTSVTYLKGGAGYSVQEGEPVEGSLEIENDGGGMKVTSTLNGAIVSGTDPNRICESFDTVAMVSYGGNTESITFTQCEIKRTQ